MDLAEAVYHTSKAISRRATVESKKDSADKYKTDNFSNALNPQYSNNNQDTEDSNSNNSNTNNKLNTEGESEVCVIS
jgi:hypothetical protein